MSNPLCHFEFMTNDPAKCRAFYGQVFDWQFDDKAMPGYTLVRPGSEPHGGIFQKPPDAPCPCLNVYFNVENIDAALNKAVELGAKVLVTKTPIPHVGHFAMFADPEGIVVGLLQSAS